jgi:hypothetical protein
MIVRSVILWAVIVRGLIVRVVIVSRIVGRGCRLLRQGLLDRRLGSLPARRLWRRRLNGCLAGRRNLALRVLRLRVLRLRVLGLLA